MRISVFVAVFNFSGVPLAQLRLANALVNRGFKVDLVVLKSYVELDKLVDPSIKVYLLDKVRAINSITSIANYIIKQKPTIVFSAEDHLNCVLLIALLISFSNAQVSCSARVPALDKQAYFGRIFSKGWFLKNIMRLVMHRANCLTCVSKDMVIQYKRIFPSHSHTYAYNIIVTEQRIKNSYAPISHPWFLSTDIPVVISVGRLDPEKGFEDLIRAFALVIKDVRSRLFIVGDGKQKDYLLNLISKLGLNDSIQLHGSDPNPLKFMRRSNVFALASYSEGMPNVLVESMMCGCTPVSTDCPTGPRELLDGGKYGYLVPVGDPLNLASGIIQALNSPMPIDLLTQRVDAFTEDSVLRRQFSLLGYKTMPYDL